MPLIALTGGIGAGKSTVARRLADHGAVVIDADKLAREAVAAGSPGLAAVRDRFGDAVIAADGTLDRAALGAIVFADDRAREDLNRITHPEVRRLFREAVAREDPAAIIVYDVPLLAEGGGADQFDSVLVVEAEPELRIQRLVETRGMAREEAERRIASQASNAERRAIADHVIDTNGSLEDTLAEVDVYWAALGA